MKAQLLDPALKAVLQAFHESWAEKRADCFRGLDFEALRETLAGVKDRAVAGQEGLLARFEDEAARRGSRVLRASDGDEANRLVLEILKTHGARTVVKSKSMVSEETGLNAYLAGKGVDAKETDLGEWIVQTARQAPTHMVLPAIHLSRGDVAEILGGHLGRPVADDIPSLVRTARDEIRKDILAAGAGLTGANALVAENGAVMLVTNEGNGRLVSSVPPVHIVLASLEKVLPGVADALSLLKLLTRNATGQRITSYVSFIAGPQRAAQYVILLDNHRRELGADPVFRDVLRCVKCSACLNVCPVYQVVGGRRFSHVYMGGIGSLLTAWIHGLEKSRDLASLCLGCHRCETVCATKIPIAGLVTALKGRLAEKSGEKLWKRIALDAVIGRPAVQRAAFGAARAARPVVRRKGYARPLPLWMKRYDRFRALPAPAPKPLSRLIVKAAPDRKAGPGQGKGRVTLFAGCLVEHVYPEVGLAAARVLAGLGYEVVPGPPGCCGFPAWNAGHAASARRAFRHVFRKIEAEGPVITLCPTCTTMLARAGPDLLLAEGQAAPPGRKRGRDGVPDARGFAARVIAFSVFLARNEREGLQRLLARGAPGPPVTYHDSCHHQHVLEAAEDSRVLLRLALGREVVEMTGPASCCGFAGTFSVEHPEVGEALLADKLAAVDAAGAELVALDCPGCLLQIRGGLARRGRSTRVKHLAEVLDERLRRPSPPRR